MRRKSSCQTNLSEDSLSISKLCIKATSLSNQQGNSQHEHCAREGKKYISEACFSLPFSPVSPPCVNLITLPRKGEKWADGMLHAAGFSLRLLGIYNTSRNNAKPSRLWT